MKNIFITILIILLLLAWACHRDPSHESWVIDLPETKKPQDFNQWGIVKYALPKLREAPDETSDIINYLPLGVAIKIIKKDNILKSFDNELDYWYYVDYDGEKGWIFGSFIEIFNSYEEAENRCEEILNVTNE